MKKIIGIIFSLFLVIAIVSCAKEEEEDTLKYKDGTYTSESEDKGYGYEKGIVVIENDEIKSIDLQRLNPDGTEVNYDLWVGQPDESGKVLPNLKEYRVTIANEIIQKQSTEGVDTIAGATWSTENWIQIVNDCLAQAEK